MEFKKWVEKLLKEHQNPVVKFDINRTKYNNLKNTPEEKDELERRIKQFKDVLSLERVDRRCYRNKLTWLKKENIGRIDKGVGTKFRFMGFQDKSGIYVYPEGAMFLLETNRAEITMPTVPINIDQAFSLFFHSAKEYLKYKAYRELTLKGVEVKRANEINVDDLAKKQKIGDSELTEETKHADDNPTKRKKKRQKNDDECKEQNMELKRRLERMQSNGAKTSRDFITKTSDYIMKSAKTKKNYNLYVLYGKELDPSIGTYKGDNNVHCSVTGEILFYKFIPVDLPTILT